MTMEDYLWAHHCVVTRSMELEDGKLVVIPFMDFANHSSHPNARWDIIEDGMILIATENIKSNQEIFISYGNLTNWQLFFTHGFALKINANQAVAFPPPLDYLLGGGSLANFEAKKNFIDSLPNPTLEDRFNIMPPNTRHFHPLNSTLGVLSDFYLAAILVCVLDDFSALTIHSSAISFLEWVSKHPNYDVFTLRALSILQDCLYDTIENLDQELEDDLILQPRIAMLDIVRQSEKKTLLAAHSILNSLTEKLVETPHIQEYLKDATND
jgi:hypothetical protein